MLKIGERKNGITIECRVTPRSGKNKIKGERSGVLLVTLAAPPLTGRANEALIDFMAATLEIPRSRVLILKGEKGRNKLIFVEGINKKTFEQKCG